MKKIIYISFFILLIVSCKKKTVTETPINTVLLTLESGGKIITANWSDPDGPGGAEPTIDTIFLSMAGNYNGSIALKNINNGTNTDLTPEIKAHQNEHLFNYSGPGIFNITDKDDNGLPLGITFTLKADSIAKISTLMVNLYHFDGVPKSNGWSSDQDIQIQYPTVIK